MLFSAPPLGFIVEVESLTALLVYSCSALRRARISGATATTASAECCSITPNCSSTRYAPRAVLACSRTAELKRVRLVLLRACLAGT